MAKVHARWTLPAWLIERAVLTDERRFGLRLDAIIAAYEPTTADRTPCPDCHGSGLCGCYGCKGGPCLGCGGRGEWEDGERPDPVDASAEVEARYRRKDRAKGRRPR